MDRHADARATSFRFSRMLPTQDGHQLDRGRLGRLALRLTRPSDEPGDSRVPAGYTYFGQFAAHDLSFDLTHPGLGTALSVTRMKQANSPALDLDSLYGDGPGDPRSARFYVDGGPALRTGTTSPIAYVPELPGYDLPRGDEGSEAERRVAVIPDARNDDNLAVAQIHAAFIRVHNRVVATRTDEADPPADRFDQARRIVTRHFQWLVWNDFLPRVCDSAVLRDVWRHGRKVHEPDAPRDEPPTMPVEFSIAAFRLGHSMVRSAYGWNVHADLGLADLFTHSARGGDLGGRTRLRSTRVADLRRLFRFRGIADGLPDAELNFARRVDTRLSMELRRLPPGTFGGAAQAKEIEHNLAFRNLMRARDVGLATGQDLARRFAQRGVRGLGDVRLGEPGAELGALGGRGMRHTPLWIYVLREAELNDGRLHGVGARIVAETFHRAIHGSRTSIIDDRDWEPSLGRGPHPYTLADLLAWAFERQPAALAPLEAIEAARH
jgi:hypothetical protein